MREWKKISEDDFKKTDNGFEFELPVTEYGDGDITVTMKKIDESSNEVYSTIVYPKITRTSTATVITVQYRTNLWVRY